MTTELELYGFLAALLKDQRSDNPLQLSAWQNKFLSDYSYAQRQSIWLTDGRRKSVDNMWRRYGPDLKHPHPADAVLVKPDGYMPFKNLQNCPCFTRIS